ncbi:MAG: enoyl-CoA hydratase/isomerase family protein [Acidimicrobiia bacterium]|nr:enoyl-CoA hydratase/isomerase family protein [Acidimicrobiia bacterium]
MSEPEILVDVAGPIRTVTLNRAAKRNALTPEMLKDTTAAFRGEPGADERVAVIRSTGPVFCAGIDLQRRLDDPSPSPDASPQEDAPGGAITGSGPTSAVERLFHSVEQWPLPVVAVVQGDAIAGGNELALHCDVVVASTKANFGMSLAQIGLAPTWFLTKKLLEVAGPVTTREILMLGDPIPASRLADLGVIARAVPAHRLSIEADAVIDRLARNAPLSLRAIKGVINREMAFRDQIEHGDVDALVAAAGASQDARVGIAARLAQESPTFTAT